MFSTRDIFLQFWSRLAATPQGRRHIYSFVIAAEEGDEHGVFDLLAERIENMELKKLVRVHQADEERHAGLFKACLERMGATQETIPPELLIIRRMGGKFGDNNADAIELYAMLRAIEVRGVEQFPIIADALRPYDSFGADTFLAVAADEKKHVGFCDRIGSREARSEAVWQAAVAKYEEIEKFAFLEHGIVSLRYAIQQRLFEPGLVEKVMEWLFERLETVSERFSFVPGMNRLKTLRL